MCTRLAVCSTIIGMFLCKKCLYLIYSIWAYNIATIIWSLVIWRGCTILFCPNDYTKTYSWGQPWSELVPSITLHVLSNSIMGSKFLYYHQVITVFVFVFCISIGFYICQKSIWIAFTIRLYPGEEVFVLSLGQKWPREPSPSVCPFYGGTHFFLQLNIWKTQLWNQKPMTELLDGWTF